MRVLHYTTYYTYVCITGIIAHVGELYYALLYCIIILLLNAWFGTMMGSSSINQKQTEQKTTSYDLRRSSRTPLDNVILYR